MRQKKYQIKSKSEIEKILQANRVGRLATNGSDGYPYITPLNYIYSDGVIYLHCAREGERIDNIKRDNKVCFEVDEPVAYIDTGFSPEKSACSVTQLYRSVIIRGKAALVDDINEKVDALNKLIAVHEGIDVFCEITPDIKAVKACAVIRITIDSMTGKQNIGGNRPSSFAEDVVKYKPELAEFF